MSKLPIAAAGSTVAESFFRFVRETDIIASLARGLRRHIAERATRRLLEELSEEQLKDIGLSRSMIESSVREQVRRYHADY